MKTSHLITSSLAALAVVGSVGLVFAQTTTPGSTMDQTPGVTTQQTPGSTNTTPMATPPSGSMNSTTPSTTDSMNNNASMNEPMARADRN